MTRSLNRAVSFEETFSARDQRTSNSPCQKDNSHQRDRTHHTALPAGYVTGAQSRGSCQEENRVADVAMRRGLAYGEDLGYPIAPRL